MSADLCFTADSFFFLSFCFRQLFAELAEWNSIISRHMVGSKCNLKTHVWNVRYPFPYKSGPKPHLFRLFRLFRPFPNLRATSAAYIVRKKHEIISGQVYCKLQGVSYIVSKRHELWSTSGFKLEVSFYRPSVNSAFHFIARLHKRRSANRTQPNFAKRCAVNRANSLP